MPAIKYSDYPNGHDDTGDGSPGNPYKTIFKASTGLTGGDEVRVAKSSDPSSLSGTLAWVDDSATINTSVDLTGVLAAKDFVGKDTAGETWWEIASITSTVITLANTYRGITETVASKKLGITDVGVVGEGAVVEEINASGVSIASRLKISGGWNLGTELQDGETWNCNTGANKYGDGFKANGKYYIELEKINSLRFFDGFNLSNSQYWLCSMTSNSNAGNYGVRFNNALGCEATVVAYNNTAPYGGVFTGGSRRCTFQLEIFNTTGVGIRSYNGCEANVFQNTDVMHNTGIGVKMEISNFNVYDTCNISDNGSYGLELLLMSSYNRFIDCNINRNGSHGVRFHQGCADNEFINPVIADNGGWGLNQSGYDGSCHLKLINPTFSGNASGDFNISTMGYVTEPTVLVQHYGSDKVDKVYFEDGVVEHITGAEARGGSGDAVRFDPSNATYYIYTKVYTKAVSGIEKTLKIYMKDDGDFNGDVQAELYFLGKIITSETWTMTTNYTEFDIVAASGDITEDGVLELKIKVRGTAGYVYADDFSIV